MNVVPEIHHGALWLDYECIALTSIVRINFAGGDIDIYTTNGSDDDRDGIDGPSFENVAQAREWTAAVMEAVDVRRTERSVQLADDVYVRQR